MRAGYNSTFGGIDQYPALYFSRYEKFALYCAKF